MSTDRFNSLFAVNVAKVVLNKRRSIRMAQSINPTLKGTIFYDDQKVNLPSPMSFKAMQDLYGDTKITKLRIGDMFGPAIDGS